MCMYSELVEELECHLGCCLTCTRTDTIMIEAVHLSHTFFNDSSLLRALLACIACIRHWHVSCACSSHDHVYVIIRLLLDILCWLYMYVVCRLLQLVWVEWNVLCVL